ncbi:MAG: hypothetical protein ACI4N3_00800 [Alphaproteobacteria bacterium]
MQKFKEAFGRSMMEMLLYLGLVIVVTTAAIKLYTESVEKTKLINAQNQIRDIAKSVNMIYIGRDFPTSGDITAKLKAKNINLIDPWKGAITVTAKNAPTGGTGSFVRPYFGIKMKLSKANCVKLSSALIDDTIGINPKSNGTTSLSYGVDEFAKNCQDNHDVYFWFKKE